jgi:hypothetical protein
MIGAMVVISRAQLRISHDTVAGFLREAGCRVGRVHVRLCDPSGVAIAEESWCNESIDATALAEEVADHIARSASDRTDLEAIITVEG